MPEMNRFEELPPELPDCPMCARSKHPLSLVHGRRDTMTKMIFRPAKNYDGGSPVIYVGLNG